MGGPSVETNGKTLEDALNEALKNYFPRLESASNVRTGFYNKFKSEAEEHDREFLAKHNADLDTTLIFAGLFSAVASAFILAVQTQLQPDYTQLTYDAFVTFANSTGRPLPSRPSSDSPWTGPDPTLVHVQCVLFSSLAASILSAFVAMLGKQWLNRYAKVDVRGSLVARSRDRQRKIDGMTTWGFNFVMESLPLLLQFALLLLGYALSHYLFTIDKVIAAVVIGFTGVGLLFYAVIAISALASYNCPFQTPFSLVVRSVFHSTVRLFKKRGKNPKGSGKWLQRMFPQRKQPGPNQGQGVGTAGGNHTELTMTGPFDYPPMWLDQEPDRKGYVLDSKCIAWMFDRSTDADVIPVIMEFIPDIVWHADIQATPLERLYDTVVECFDRSSGRPVVVPKLKNKAYLSAKALLHVAIQRKCMAIESDTELFNSISGRHTENIGSKDYGGDSDLESTLGIIDRVFKADGSEPMPWDKFSFTVSHHSWMSQILLYRTSYVLEGGGRLPDDIKQFVSYSLRLRRDHPLPTSIVSNCLLIIGLAFGIKWGVGNQQATNGSNNLCPPIYEKLEATFQNPNPTAEEIDSALEALELIASLSEEDVAKRSYHLFHLVMQVPLNYPEEKKWKASRLALRGAYRWDGVVPPVGKPQDILAFLEYHFRLVAKLVAEMAAQVKNQDGPARNALAAQLKDQDEPIHNALRALALAHDSTTTEDLKRFGSAELSFVLGIRHAFQDGRPLRLRQTALLFLPLIADKWFKTPDAIMKPEEMKDFCVDWASVVGDVKLATPRVRNAALKVLFGMINSPHWRAHIVKGKWELLKDFISDPVDSEPLEWCLKNPDLIDKIPVVGKPAARTHWLAIMWLNYEKLTPGIQGKLKGATRNLQQPDFNVCSSAVDKEIENVGERLKEYVHWDQSSEAAALRTKRSNLQKAKDDMLNRGKQLQAP